MSRWTDLAAWRGPTINEGDGDGTPGEAADALRSYRGLVVHIASGFYEGTISWQQNPAADVSSHFVVARDGRIAQCVDTADRAWTQRTGNSDWLSVECEGFALDDGLHASHPGWERLTDAQIMSIARLLERGHRQYGYPLTLAGSPTGKGLGYHSMGAEHGYDWGHLHCPGEPIKAQLPGILARAQQLAAGTSTTNTTEVDMNLSDKVTGSGLADGSGDLSVEQILRNLSRSVDPYGTAPGSATPLAKQTWQNEALRLARDTNGKIAAPPVVDVDYLARTIADALIESNANKLTADDQAAIVASVKVALRDGTDN